MKRLTSEHATEVCKFGRLGEDVCSYLVIDRGRLVCAKGTNIQRIIDRRREDSTMNAMGDNCGGREGSIEPPEK